jgi:molecular chaperone GrpE
MNQDGRDNSTNERSPSSDDMSSNNTGSSSHADHSPGLNGLIDSEITDAQAEAKSQADKFKSDYLYLRAEFENFKKQAIKERSDLRKYGSERLIVDLLGILDIFETALSTDASPENAANFRKGIEMTAAELKSALHRHGVEEVAARGKPFDPVLHEALSSEETDSVPAGTITQVFKKPYRLYDRIVRPGQVVVAKSKS